MQNLPTEGRARRNPGPTKISVMNIALTIATHLSLHLVELSLNFMPALSSSAREESLLAFSLLSACKLSTLVYVD